MPLERACRKAGPFALLLPIYSGSAGSRYNLFVKRPDPFASPKAKSNLEEIDALLSGAGLVRNRRQTPAGMTRHVRLMRAVQEELSVAAPTPHVAANGIHWLLVPGWQRLAWLWHGFSTRRGGGSRAYCADGAEGELNLGFTASDDRQVVLRNRRLLAEAVTGSPDSPLVTLRQFHSNLTRSATRGDAHSDHPNRGDGLITAEPGLLLAIQTADCIPVLVADRKRRVVAAFHAGWRGTVKRIVENGVGIMRLQFGSRPQDLTAAIGPGIGACCYAVGEEVLSGFESQFSYARELFREVYDSDPVRTKYPMLFLTQRAPGHSSIGPSLHLDLTEANRRQLLEAGIPSGAISLVGGCTSCQPELFFSHRASHGHAGRMLSVIGIRPS
jgi:YfiH family protein